MEEILALCFQGIVWFFLQVFGFLLQWLAQISLQLLAYLPWDFIWRGPGRRADFSDRIIYNILAALGSLAAGSLVGWATLHFYPEGTLQETWSRLAYLILSPLASGGLGWGMARWKSKWDADVDTILHFWTGFCFSIGILGCAFSLLNTPAGDRSDLKSAHPTFHRSISRYDPASMMLRLFALVLAFVMTNSNSAHAEKIIVVVKPVAPFVMEENGKFTGYSIDLWNEVARTAGWTDVEFRKVDTVPAMIAALKSGQADVGVGALSITAERSKQIDFSHPFYDSGLDIMVKGGSNTGPLALLIRLLTPGLLIAFVALLIVLIIVSHVLWWFERGKNPNEFPQPYREGIIESFWWTTCVLIGGLSLNADPKGITGRVIGAVWAIIGIAMISYLTATATTIMTVDSLSNEINGPRDLVGKPVATLQGSSAARYLQAQNLKATEFAKMEDAVHALDQGQVKAVVYDAPVMMYYLAEHQSKDLHLVGHLFDKQKYGFGLQLGSKLRLPMNSALLSVAETDFPQKLDKLYFTPDEP